MKSLREHAACVDASGDFSVMGDVLGFARRRLPPDPSGVPAAVSLRAQIDAVAGRHIHVNIIRVGFDALTAAQRITAVERIDFALLRIREIYRPANIGVGRVLHWFVDQADADGRDDIGSEDECEDIADEWTVDNDGIDVFMVRTISGDFIGRSPIDGACGKDESDDGLVGGAPNDRGDGNGVARTFAHEVGHFLGLEHNHGDDCPTAVSARERLMAQTRCAVSDRDSVTLTAGERSTMRDHCVVRNGC